MIQNNMNTIKDIKEKFSKNKIKCFIVEIKILSNEWHYKINDIIFTVIFCKRQIDVDNKIDNIFSGSEFPSYDIISIKETDNFIFNWQRQ